MNSIRYYYQCFKYGIKNLFTYFPIIWKDRDWDQYYFYVLLQFKLKKIRDRLNLNLFEGSEDVVKEIDIAIEALERIIDDNYCKEEWSLIDDKYGKLIVIDGRQRLTALFEFMDDKYKLRKLKILSDLNDKSFSQLSPVLQSRIEDYQIQAHVIMPPTPDRIKFDIFDRVNRGGMMLNKQEIRNALYQGNATRFLNELVKSTVFSCATGKAFAREKRMKDKYLITRFLAIYMYQHQWLKNDDGSLYEYKDDIDDLLGRTMDYMNHMTEEELKNLYTVVQETLEKSFFYLGGDAFRSRSDSSRKTPVNMNVFETIMYIMTFISLKID